MRLGKHTVQVCMISKNGVWGMCFGEKPSVYNRLVQVLISRCLREKACIFAPLGINLPNMLLHTFTVKNIQNYDTASSLTYAGGHSDTGLLEALICETWVRVPKWRKGTIPLLTININTITTTQLYSKQAFSQLHDTSTIQTPSKINVCLMYSDLQYTTVGNQNK
jgi:hypothetical protein